MNNVAIERVWLVVLCGSLLACSSTPGGAADTGTRDDVTDTGRRPVATDDDTTGGSDDAENGSSVPDSVTNDTTDDGQPSPDAQSDTERIDVAPEHDAATGPDADANADSGTADDADVFVCDAVTATANPANRPADIIWIVDNSLSMQEEVVLVSDGINAFVNFIERDGIDARVVMISYDNPVVGDGWYHVCVPPPLSATAPGVCPTGRDVDSPRYLHVREIVDSNEPLSKVIDEYSSYSSFLRPDAVTHIVAVTDDNSEIDAATFTGRLSALRPGFASNPVVHSLVTQARSDIRDPFDDSCTSPGCPCGFAVGAVYQQLATLTGGITSSICEADWSPIFEAIASSVVLSSAVPCSYPIPDPPGSLTVNPAQINVAATPEGGARSVVANVDGASACGGLPGWYFDNPTLPTRVQLCPASCEEVTGTVDIEYGCDTVKR